MRHLPSRRLVYFIIVDIALIATALTWLYGGRASLGDMKIMSGAFAHDGGIPAEYTCDGPGISPPLEWGDVPADAKSLALIVDDPDAPAGTWTHWVVWNIATTDGGIGAGEAPAGAVQGTTSSQVAGWHAPCPPFGMHRYFFKLFALDVRLDLPVSATAADLEKAMEGHVLDKAGLVGRYERKSP